MTSGMNFWDVGVWSFVVTITLLLVFMMLANALRNLIPALKRLMIPSAVLGGFLALFASFLFKKLTGHHMFPAMTLEALTYHGLGLGFAAMSLRTLEKQKDKTEKTGAFDTGVAVVGGYLLQGLVGLVISVVLYYLIGSFFASGALLPLGYGQGPGQAYNWGRTFEYSYGFTHGTSFGLTVAAAGFIAASIGGVVYLNVMRRKGRLASPGENPAGEHVTHEMISGADEVPMLESMDKLTIQFALVFMAYFLAYLFMRGMNVLIAADLLGDFGRNTVQPLIWGFNFLFATVFALLLKTVLRALRKKGVIKREYSNNFMQTRIAGFSFDIMVVASIAAINLKAFTYAAFVLPLALICVAGAVVTYIYLLIVSKRVFPKYPDEAFLSLYGMQTGTASTGVILLREADPKFLTQASNNIVYHQPWAIIFGFPMLLLLGVAPRNVGWSLITIGVLVVLFAVMCLILFRRSIFKKKTKS
ncbi:MAG: hypothetical protein IK136_02635 [Oscillospiraceae bacterium]|nr:hypothetical protein [Oscillospiraceae bacterium]